MNPFEARFFRRVLAAFATALLVVSFALSALPKAQDSAALQLTPANGDGGLSPKATSSPAPTITAPSFVQLSIGAVQIDNPEQYTIYLESLEESGKVSTPDNTSKSYYVDVNASSLPVVSEFGPPCISGEIFKLTGSIFTWSLDMAWRSPYHPGVDGACYSSWTVGAAADGIIYKFYPVLAYWTYESAYWWMSGTACVIEHNFGGKVYYTAYGHLAAQDDEATRLCVPGRKVSAGDPIGVSGKPRHDIEISTGLHLHYSIWSEEHIPLDPKQNGAFGTRP